MHEIPTQEFIGSCCHYINIDNIEGEADDIHDVLLVHHNSEFLMPHLNDPAVLQKLLSRDINIEELWQDQSKAKWRRFLYVCIVALWRNDVAKLKRIKELVQEDNVHYPKAVNLLFLFAYDATSQTFSFDNFLKNLTQAVENNECRYVAVVSLFGNKLYADGSYDVKQAIALLRALLAKQHRQSLPLSLVCRHPAKEPAVADFINELLQCGVSPREILLHTRDLDVKETQLIAVLNRCVELVYGLKQNPEASTQYVSEVIEISVLKFLPAFLWLRNWPGHCLEAARRGYLPAQITCLERGELYGESLDQHLEDIHRFWVCKKMSHYQVCQAIKNINEGEDQKYLAKRAFLLSEICTVLPLPMWTTVLYNYLALNVANLSSLKPTELIIIINNCSLQLRHPGIAEKLLSRFAEVRPSEQDKAGADLQRSLLAEIKDQVKKLGAPPEMIYQLKKISIDLNTIINIITPILQLEHITFSNFQYWMEDHYGWLIIMYYSLQCIDACTDDERNKRFNSIQPLFSKQHHEITPWQRHLVLALIQQDKNCNVFPMSIYHQMIKYHERRHFGDYQFEVCELPAESDEEKKPFIDPSAISIVAFNNSLTLDHRYFCDILLGKMTEQRHQRWMTIVECYLAECIQRQSNHNVMETLNARDTYIALFRVALICQDWELLHIIWCNNQPFNEIYHLGYFAQVTLVKFMDINSLLPTCLEASAMVLNLFHCIKLPETDPVLPGGYAIISSVLKSYVLIDNN